MRALLAALCCMGIAACAAGGRAKSAAPSTEAGAVSPMPASPRDQIEELEAEITAQRIELKLDEPTDTQIQSAPAEPMGATPSSQDPTCRPAPTETCKTSCTLSDAICSNADKICTLAKGMQGDTWAANKCAKANTTCEASRTKCCGCQ